jgi:hypothetical protein
MCKSEPVFTFGSFMDRLIEGRNFVFVRFSDGEIEVLKNRELVIAEGKTQFRGEGFSNDFDKHDSKVYIPKKMDVLRQDLLASLVHRSDNYIKGIPSAHVNAEIDQDYCLRMNGGMDENITYADLLINWNYGKFRDKFIPYVCASDKNVVVIANENSVVDKIFSINKLITVPSNFFPEYVTEKSRIIEEIDSLESESIILSSASSLSNVLGHYISANNLGHTFVDVGSAINPYLGFGSTAREFLQSSGKPYTSHFGYSNYEW